MSKKDGEKVNIVVLLLILISVATLGIVFFYVAKFAGSAQNANETESIKVSEKVYSQEEIDVKSAECDSIGNLNQKDWCLLDLAKEYHVDKCSDMTQPQFKSYCTAIMTKNEKMCEDILTQTVKDACYISLAQITGKERLCKKTSREEFCLSLVS